MGGAVQGRVGVMMKSQRSKARLHGGRGRAGKERIDAGGGGVEEVSMSSSPWPLQPTSWPDVWHLPNWASASEKRQGRYTSLCESGR